MWLALEVAAAAEPRLAATPSPSPQTEISGVPILFADGDRGIGFGALGAVARFKEGYAPFRWRLQALAFLTVKEGSSGGLVRTSEKYRLRLDLPGLAAGWLRLNLDLRFARELGSYYGIGNAAATDAARANGYERKLPALETRVRVKLTRHLSLMTGGSFAYNWITVHPESQLAADLAAGAPASPALRELLRGVGQHALWQSDVGLVWDTRDNELAPTRGSFYELSARYAPGLASAEDLTYAGANVTLRYFQRLTRTDRVVFAGRLLGDVLFGHPPLDALARTGGFEPECAIGGDRAVRGIPRSRYIGKVKLLGNAELRFKLVPFTAFRQRFLFGAVAFFDAGRVWADTRSQPLLDGRGLGLKFGTGGGLRLQWNRAFMIRADAAWSPDADPIGFYFNVNHVF